MRETAPPLFLLPRCCPSSHKSNPTVELTLSLAPIIIANVSYRARRATEALICCPSRVVTRTELIRPSRRVSKSAGNEFRSRNHYRRKHVILFFFPYSRINPRAARDPSVKLSRCEREELHARTLRGVRLKIIRYTEIFSRCVLSHGRSRCAILSPKRDSRFLRVGGNEYSDDA